MTHHQHVPAMVLAGLGAYLPEEVVTNDDLSRVMDTSDEWISSRTGISQRRRAAEGQTSLHLAVEAGREALKHHGEGTAIDAVVVATSTPHRLCPATAPDVATALGAWPLEAWGGPFYAAVFGDPDDITGMQADIDQIARLGVMKDVDRGNLGVLAPGGDGVDVTSRFFAPASGIPEDPATGSWHCMVAAIMCARLKNRSIATRPIPAAAQRSASSWSATG